MAKGGIHSPPCLLTMPTYLGTLAAARCLGAHGVPVVVAGSELLAPARWSRYVTRFVRCPSPREPERFLEWLLAFGDREPGHFLYPSSDDVAFFYAFHRQELAKRFCLLEPDLDALIRVLDKKALHGTCCELGIPTPQTWYPESEEEVRELAPRLPYPLLIKPRTQVMLASLSKGVLAKGPDELLKLYPQRILLDSYPPATVAAFGGPLLPMLQVFCEQARRQVYSLQGFFDGSGELLAVRASNKVLQRPRRGGIGVCFEEAPVDAGLVEDIVRLCRAVGYFGVFEAEFIAQGSRHVHIDFNPRFYGQMGFENARGLPLPLFAWLAAKGDEEGLRALAEKARESSGDSAIYCHRFYVAMTLFLQRASGSIDPSERARWEEWYAARRDRAVDASADPRDPLPGVMHAAAELLGAVRHARSFLRSDVLNRE